MALAIDGVLYYRVVEPYNACYGVEDADFAITQLAQTTMRSEIGKLTLDRTLAERNLLNASIVEAINEASVHWGIRCLRYEIRTTPLFFSPLCLSNQTRRHSASRIGSQGHALASLGRASKTRPHPRVRG